ncbi:MAG TPA: hypothetical protein PLE09_03170 [Caldisericia bacterium]|nr:hypothetical protein [Caldisericia bacterium]
MLFIALAAYFQTWVGHFLLDQFPSVIKAIQGNTSLQNGLLFVTLFFFTESIVIFLSYLLLLRKPALIRKTLTHVSSSFHLDESDSPKQIHDRIERIQDVFDQQIQYAIKEVSDSIHIFDRFQLKKSSTWLTILNVIVFFILLLNVQFFLTFHEILSIFFASLLFCGFFLIAHRFTVRWMLDPKKGSSLSIYHSISKQHSNLHSLISRQIQDFLKKNYSTIETTLGKDIYLQPEFYRFQDPRWIDFQKGFMVNDPIFKKVRNSYENQTIMIQSDHSSGKTTFGYYVGYELARHGTLVLYMSFRQNQIKPQALLDLASLLEGGDSFLIVDDLHLAQDDEFFHEEYYSSIQNRVLFLRNKPFLSTIQNCLQLQLHNNLSNRIVDRFLMILKRQSYDLSLIKKIVEMRLTLDHYHDLSQLCFKLHSLQMNTPTKEILAETIQHFHLTNLILPIAYLGQYEIPIRKDFLTNFCNILPEDIDKSTLTPLIQKTSTKNPQYLYLSHPSLANHIIEVYRHASLLDKESEDPVSITTQDTKATQNDFLVHYLQKFPEEGITVLSRIPIEVCNQLTTHKEFPQLFKTILMNTMYVNESLSYNFKNSELKSVFSSLSLPSIKTIIESLQKKCPFSCLLFICEHYDKCNQLPSTVFQNLIEETQNLEDISALLLFLKEIHYPHIDGIPPSLFASKIKNSSSISETGHLMNTLKETFSGELFNVVIKLLPASIFVNQIKNTEDLPYISKLIKDLQAINYPFIREIEPTMLVEKIHDNNNLETISWFLSSLQVTVSPSFFLELIQLIPPNLIAEKIEASDDLRSIGLLLTYLEEIQYIYITKLPPMLFESKIRMGTNLRDIGMLLCTLKEVCTKSSFRYVLRTLPAWVFIEKIKEQSHLHDIGILLSTLHKIQYNDLTKIPMNLYVEKLQECPSLSQIEMFLNTLRPILQQTNFQILLSSFSIQVLQEKISGCEDLQELCSFLNALYKNKYRNMHQIPAVLFVEKIRKSDDIEDIQSILKTLTRIQYTHLVEVLELLDPEVFREKMFFSKDVAKSISLLCQLRLINYPHIDSLENSVRSM